MDKMQSLEGGSTSRSAVSCLLGLLIFAAAMLSAVFGGKVVLGKEGHNIFLPCLQNGNVKVTDLKWVKIGNSQDTHFLTWDGNQILRGAKVVSDPRFTLESRNANNGNFSMIMNSLSTSDAGDYKCTFSNQAQIVHLYVFQLHASPGNPLLFSESLNLTLKTHPSENSNLKVTWKGPKNQTFNNVSQTLQIVNLSDEHKEEWRCRIHHDQSTQDLEIMHTVQKIGFPVNSFSRKFSKINETVVIPCKLSFEIKSKIENIQVQAAGVYKSSKQEDVGLKQQIKYVNISDNGSCWQEECGHKSSLLHMKDFSVTLTSVQFSDAGWYTCLVEFNRGNIQTEFQLLIVRVSAKPQALITINSPVNLTCEVSASLHNSVVRWTHVNGSSANSKEGKNTTLLTLTLRVNASHFGLWRCSISVDGQVLFSMDQELEEIPDHVNLWFWAAVGAGTFAILILTICTVICIARDRRRRRAQRMVRLRKQLYEQKTCQCKMRLHTAYYQS
ncbi:T-cell surface glycoprotein CD4 [Microcaecilia unicolor]|uniref:T-cell surface glycoprotein CD4 n=1 Tax=Microcaecilia unicolor TaxID=1415580 RepID=A0A6P7WZE2_9AMPH|nr:T-cell surface glycoprotein CD4 [Microcaecilia unicolor]